MDKETILAEFLVASIPGLLIALLTVGFTFGFGQLQTRFANRRAARKEAYDALYVPFIALMFKSNAWLMPFSQMPGEIQAEFYQLLIKNIRYMDRDNLKWFHLFHGHLGNVLVGNKTGEYGALTPDRLSEVFSALVESLLTRAGELAQGIHQPDLGMDTLELYREYQMIRDKTKSRNS